MNQTKTPPHRPAFLKWMDWILQGFLLITLLCVCVPLSPVLPSSGLDASWNVAMNQAAAQLVAFGKDFIFTYGPYSALITHHYHPAVDVRMLASTLYFAFTYWVCLIGLLSDHPHRGRRLVVVTLVVAGALVFFEPLVWAYPLAVAIFAFKLVHEPISAKCRYPWLWMLFLLSPFGLLSLVKGTSMVLCFTVAVLISLLFVAYQKYTLALISVVTPLLSLMLFWLLAGQSLWALPAYFEPLFAIMSGFNEAMAVRGEALEIYFYLLMTFLMLTPLWLTQTLTRVARLFLTATFLVFLGLGFKAGFVRHDGHALMAGVTMVLAATWLLLTLRTRWIWPILCGSVVFWCFIRQQYAPTTLTNSLHDVSRVYSSAWDGLKSRLRNPDQLPRDFASAMSRIQAASHFPKLAGTSDIYPVDIAELLAAGNTWNPRPVMQSYSAYTPLLIHMNQAHLLGSHAPDNLIFQIGAIDNRLPSLEDGLSWPTIWQNYHLSLQQNGFLFLRKNQGTPINPPLPIIERALHAFGRKIEVPNRLNPVMVELHIKPSLLGRLASFLFKPSRLKIILELADGTQREYRMISAMAKTGFVISPLIATTEDFGLLYAANRAQLERLRVKSFSIVPMNSVTTGLWRTGFEVVFREANFPAEVLNPDEVKE